MRKASTSSRKLVKVPTPGGGYYYTWITVGLRRGVPASQPARTR